MSIYIAGHHPTIVVTGRREGKTSGLIKELLANPNAVLIAATTPIANMTRREYPEVADRILGPDVEFLVDNAELLLAHLLGRTPTTITMSADESF